MDVDPIGNELADAIREEEEQIKELKARLERDARADRTDREIRRRLRERGVKQFVFVRGSAGGTIHLQPRKKKRPVLRNPQSATEPTRIPAEPVVMDVQDVEQSHEEPASDQVGETDAQSRGIERDIGVQVGRSLGLFAIEAINRGIDGLAMRVAMARERAALTMQQPPATQAPPVPVAGPPQNAAAAPSLEQRPAGEISPRTAPKESQRPPRTPEEEMAEFLERYPINTE